jgi:DNA modification methylase
MQSKKKIPDIELEYTTVWSFPERGSWATHKSDYRGNFAPQIARNVIEMYSRKGELILDPMVGAGTTLIEAKLLARDAIGIDINPDDYIYFSYESADIFCLGCALDIINTQVDYLLPLRNLTQYCYDKERSNG